MMARKGQIPLLEQSNKQLTKNNGEHKQGFFCFVLFDYNA
jgi:hypothetical protein